MSSVEIFSVEVRDRMAKVSKVSKATKASGQYQNELKNEIIGISLLAFALLSFVSLFSNSTGAVGATVLKVIKVITGEGRYIFPVLIMGFGFKIIRSRKRLKFGSQSIGGALLFLLFLIMLHLQLEVDEKALFHEGYLGNGGGVVGGVLTAILLAAFGRTGTYIVWTALLIIDLVLITKMSFVKVVRLAGKKLGLYWSGTKETLSGFLFTEVDDEEIYEENTIPDIRTEPAAAKKPVFLDSNVFDFHKAFRGNEEEITQNDEESLPKINIYPEPIEKIMANEENREQAEIISFAERRAKTKDEPDFVPVQQVVDTFQLPPLSLFQRGNKPKNLKTNKDITDNVRILEETLESFGVKAKVTQVSRGPAITRYELQPAPGVKVSRIVNLADDIALSMAASGVRIEAPIPGKAAVGIEVPNKETAPVTMRELLESEEFNSSSSKLTFVLGKDIAGKTIVADLGKMPHMLIAGATGSGKSVCMNTLIGSILFKAKPTEVKLLMIDPKMVELTTYNGIPHLISPVVTDAKKAASSLRWAVREMEKRYELFARAGVKDMERFNAAVQSGAFQHNERMPSIMVVIDELADLMMVAPADVEDAICRLAQMARAAGMHLVVATQRPSVDVITGLIKANIPSRIAFNVSSQIDSRTILDMAGAEKLLGKGDMLFFPVGLPKPIRVQGAYMSDKEVEALVTFLRAQGQPEFVEGVVQAEQQTNVEQGEEDDLLGEAVKILIESGQASISMLQRRLRIGYARAARLIDVMEERGIVGKFEGSKPRSILMTMEQYQKTFENG